uniref:Uncharacterized protein n=1 Tax=Octopus bimaculoides TaxID=37653 RepID=A0A0L8HVA6_OCTBM
MKNMGEPLLHFLLPDFISISSRNIPPKYGCSLNQKFEEDSQIFTASGTSQFTLYKSLIQLGKSNFYKKKKKKQQLFVLCQYLFSRKTTLNKKASKQIS